MLRSFDNAGEPVGWHFCPADAYDPSIAEAMKASLANRNRALTPKMG
jgi:hypothetical protein